MTLSEEALQQAIDRFWETIPQLWNQIRANVRAIAAEEFCISVQQFHVLRYVRRGFGSVSELASVTQLSRPAMSQAVNALVEKGLLTRRQSAQDRRYVELELTPAGEDMLSTIYAENRRWMMEKLSVLEPDELEDIPLGLKALRKAFLEPVPTSQQTTG
ncbi:MAG: MarR family transcriptional regulator [Chloroflexi bacterium]|nr:MarR family transcriptional regulator [Chloroflexota bacterium]